MLADAEVREVAALYSQGSLVLTGTHPRLNRPAEEGASPHPNL